MLNNPKQRNKLRKYQDLFSGEWHFDTVEGMVVNEKVLLNEQQLSK